MAINKVEANGETLIDLTSDTVTADTLVSGRTAHLASGVQVTGTFEPVTGVKGNAESAYRKGNVNLTPANIGAATAAQGTKADSAVQTIQIGGTTQTKTSGTVNLPAYPTKSSLGLSNVDNTSDANKPISTATQAALDAQQAQINKALEQTGYNLFEITTESKTTNGVTFTVDKAAGTITANGTATAVTYYNMPVPPNVYGNVCLSGCANGGSDTTYDVFPKDNTTEARPTRWNGITVAESIYSASQWAEVKFVQGHTNVIQIRIRGGATVSNLQFKPMLTKPELAGVPFQPYAMSNVELTQKALIPQGKYNSVSVDGGLNFKTTDQTTLEVTEGEIILISNGRTGNSGLTIEVNGRIAECGDYYFRHNGLTASYAIDGHDSHYELIPKVDSNHNGIFRGDDLTLAWVENGKIKEALYTKVHSGDFSGLYLGDYFTVSITTDIYTKFTGSSFDSGTTYYTLGGEYPNWDYTATTDTAPTGGKMYFTKQTVTENVDLMIAAFDYYYNVGDTALTSHHLVLIPRSYGFKTTAKMNSTNTTVGSYYKSEMHQLTLPCYGTSLRIALNNHLLAHRTILPNAINASTPSMAGAGLTGASNAWAWETVELQLMSEPQIYGTTVWSSSAYDVGADCKKLPVFDFINGAQYGRNYYWLRSVVSSTHFAFCNGYGYASCYAASNALYVRPLILFG